MREVSDENGNVFIEIPKFYHKITITDTYTESSTGDYTNDPGTMNSFQIQLSRKKHDGFSTLFVADGGKEIPYIRVGKYEASGTASRVYSKTGQNVLTGLNENTAESACVANGDCYYQYDYFTHLILSILYYVEMASADVRGKLEGVYNLSAAVATGRTDSVPYKTGYPTNFSAGARSCKYRGIENIWGNVGSLCYGFDLSLKYVSGGIGHGNYYNANLQLGAKIKEKYQYQEQWYYCSYSQGAEGPYDGYLWGMRVLSNLLFYPAKKSFKGEEATQDTHFYSYGTSGNRIIGGEFNGGTKVGLWSAIAENDCNVVGTRLCYKPKPNN